MRTKAKYHNKFQLRRFPYGCILGFVSSIYTLRKNKQVKASNPYNELKGQHDCEWFYGKAGDALLPEEEGLGLNSLFVMLQKIRKIFLRISIILNGLLFRWTKHSTGLIRENADLMPRPLMQIFGSTLFRNFLWKMSIRFK